MLLLCLHEFPTACTAENLRAICSVLRGFFSFFEELFIFSSARNENKNLKINRDRYFKTQYCTNRYTPVQNYIVILLLIIYCETRYYL